MILAAASAILGFSDRGGFVFGHPLRHFQVHELNVDMCCFVVARASNRDCSQFNSELENKHYLPIPGPVPPLDTMLPVAAGIVIVALHAGENNMALV